MLSTRLILFLVLLCVCDADAQWGRVDRDSTGGFILSFISDDIGYMANGRRIWKTADGGESWLELPRGDSVSFSSLQFTSDSVAWAMDYYGMYRTSNEGNTWTDFEPYENDLPDDWEPTYIIAINDSTAFIGGNYFTLWRTSDRGLTWSRVHYQDYWRFYYFPVVDIQFIDELNGFATAGNRVNQTIHTTDGGVTWAGIGTVGDTAREYNQTPVRFHFFDAQNGLMVIGRTLRQTTDGGRTWSTRKEFPLQTTSIFDMVFVDSLRGFMLSNDSIGRVMMTTDQGYTWTSEYFEPINWSSRISFPSSKRGYFTGATGNFTSGLDLSIYRYDEGFVDVKRNKPDFVTSTPSLIERNPVRNSLTLNAPAESITITDVSGRTVLLAASTDRVDVSALSPGVYQLIVSSSDGIKSQKFVVER